MLSGTRPITIRCWRTDRGVKQAVARHRVILELSSLSRLSIHIFKCILLYVVRGQGGGFGSVCARTMRNNKERGCEAREVWTRALLFIGRLRSGTGLLTFLLAESRFEGLPEK